MAQEEARSPDGRQKLFNVIGFLGFAAIVPLVLKSVGVAGPADWLAANAGIWGSAGFFIIYFYAFPLLDLVFGSDRKLSPMLLGIIVSFLLFASVVPLPFMAWYRPLFAPLALVGSSLAVMALAMVAMLLGILLSYARRGVPFLIQLMVVVGLPVAGLVCGEVFGVRALWNLPAFPL